jgi:hypothetical protein
VDQRIARSVDKIKTIWKRRGHTFSSLHWILKPRSQCSSSRRQHIVIGPSYCMNLRFLVVSSSAFWVKFTAVFFFKFQGLNFSQQCCFRFILSWMLRSVIWCTFFDLLRDCNTFIFRLFLDCLILKMEALLSFEMSLFITNRHSVTQKTWIFLFKFSDNMGLSFFCNVLNSLINCVMVWPKIQSYCIIYSCKYFVTIFFPFLLPFFSVLKQIRWICL